MHRAANPANDVAAPNRLGTSPRTSFWKGRPKRWSRRIAHDLRVLRPVIGILLCFVSAASAIAAAESILVPAHPVTARNCEIAAVDASEDASPTASRRDAHRTAAARIDETDGEALAPVGARAPVSANAPTGTDCAADLLHDLD